MSQLAQHLKRFILGLIPVASGFWEDDPPVVKDISNERYNEKIREALRRIGFVGAQNQNWVCRDGFGSYLNAPSSNVPKTMQQQQQQQQKQP
jgi:hypothetical protein